MTDLLEILIEELEMLFSMLVTMLLNGQSYNV